MNDRYGCFSHGGRAVSELYRWHPARRRTSRAFGMDFGYPLIGDGVEQTGRERRAGRWSERLTVMCFRKLRGYEGGPHGVGLPHAMHRLECTLFTVTLA